MTATEAHRAEAEAMLSDIDEPATRWKVTLTYEFDDLAEALAFYRDESRLADGPAQFAGTTFQGMDAADSLLLNPEGCAECGAVPWARISRGRKVCGQHAA